MKDRQLPIHTWLGVFLIVLVLGLLVFFLISEHLLVEQTPTATESPQIDPPKRFSVTREKVEYGNGYWGFMYMIMDSTSGCEFLTVSQSGPLTLNPKSCL